MPKSFLVNGYSFFSRDCDIKYLEQQCHDDRITAGYKSIFSAYNWIFIIKLNQQLSSGFFYQRLSVEESFLVVSRKFRFLIFSVAEGFNAVDR